MAAPAQQSAASWTDAFPAPRSTAPTVSRDEVLSDLSSGHLLVVDVRRTDYEGGTIRGSINLPAHSFYLNRGVLYRLCKGAGIRRVAFYCGEFVLLMPVAAQHRCEAGVGNVGGAWRETHTTLKHVWMESACTCVPAHNIG